MRPAYDMHNQELEGPVGCILVILIGIILFGVIGYTITNWNKPTPEYVQMVNERAKREQKKIWLKECLKKEPAYKCSQYFD